MEKRRKTEKIKNKLSRFRISLDFTRTYILMFVLFMVLANDYNTLLAKHLGIPYYIAWVLLFVGMIVGSYLISYFFVVSMGFYAHNADVQVELSPYAQGKLSPQSIFHLKNIWLPVMKATGCKKEEIEIVEKAIKRGDWRV